MLGSIGARVSVGWVVLGRGRDSVREETETGTADRNTDIDQHLLFPQPLSPRVPYAGPTIIAPFACHRLWGSDVFGWVIGNRCQQNFE